MAGVNAKQVSPTTGELLLNRFRQAAWIRVVLGVRCNFHRDVGSWILERRRQHVEVEFSDHDLHAEFSKLVDRRVELLRSWPVKTQVVLQTNAGDRNALRLQ